MNSTGAGKGAIVSTSSRHQEVTMGKIANNEFMENQTHIGMGYGARGLNACIVHENIFQQTETITGTIMLDIRGAYGGNLILRNSFASE